MSTLEVIFIILIVIAIAAIIQTAILIAKDEYNMGYSECMRTYYSTKKATLMHEWFSPYARGWNDACIEIANKI